MAFTVPPPDRRLSWAAYDADQLMEILVADAGAAHATELGWFVGAVQRISQLRKIGLEAAFLDVRAQARERHNRELPLYSGVIL